MNENRTDPVSAAPLAGKLSIAPMMDWTDRHCRYFLRLLNPYAILYTEMVTAAAIVHGDSLRLLEFNPEEHPVVLQLGGSDPAMMADAAEAGANSGHDRININVGCPSDRVQDGQFGACLMARPDVVATCFKHMQDAVDVPVSVKTRLGIDDIDNYDFLRRFVDSVAEAGCREFIVHARIAILSGLTPKENRSVPPLRYERVYRLKQEFPELCITINGGIAAIEDVRDHLQHVDGAMIGRHAYQNPWALVEIGKALGAPEESFPATRADAIKRMIPYIERQIAAGTALKRMTRHLLGMFAGQPGARTWRRNISERSHLPGAGIEVLCSALESMPEIA